MSRPRSASATGSTALQIVRHPAESGDGRGDAARHARPHRAVPAERLGEHVCAAPSGSRPGAGARTVAAHRPAGPRPRARESRRRPAGSGGPWIGRSRRRRLAMRPAPRSSSATRRRRRHAELASLVSQLLIHNTTRGRRGRRTGAQHLRSRRARHLPARCGPHRRHHRRRTAAHSGDAPRPSRSPGTGRRAAGAVVADAASAGGSADLLRARAPRRVRPDSHGHGHDARRVYRRAQAPDPIPEASRLPKAPAVRRSARARRRKPRGGWPIWRRSSRSRSRRSIASGPVRGCCIPSSSTTSASSRRSPGMPTSSRASTASTPSSSPRATSPDCRVKSPRTCIASSRNRCTNVARHARASRAVVRLARDGRLVSLRIDDDGRGLDAGGPPAGERPGGIGITGMRERAALMNGTFTMGRSGLGGG